MTTVNVTSDLFNAGLTLEGEAYIGEVFFVEVEFDDGTIWRRNQYFNGVDCVMDDDGYYHVCVKESAVERAETLAQKVRDRLANGGDLCFTYWHNASPMRRQVFDFPVDQKADAYEEFFQAA